MCRRNDHVICHRFWEKINANYQKYSMRIQLWEAFQIYISRMETQKVLKIEILLSFNK